MDVLVLKALFEASQVDRNAEVHIPTPYSHELVKFGDGTLGGEGDSDVWQCEDHEAIRFIRQRASPSLV